MKTNPTNLRLATVFAAATAILFSTPSADALFVKSALDKAKDVTKKATTTVTNTATNAANTVGTTATNAANSVKNTVVGAANTVKDWTVKNATVALKNLAGLKNVFSADTISAVTNGIKNRLQTYATTIENKMTSAYETAKSWAKNFALQVVWKKGKEAYQRLKEKIEVPAKALRELLKNADAKTKMDTLFKRLATTGVDDEVRNIVKFFAAKLGASKWAALEGRRNGVALCGASANWPTVPYKSWPKSFQLTIGASLSAISPKIVGVSGEVRFGIVADLGKDAGKDYDVRGYFHVAGAIGGGAPGIDAAANIMLAFSPLMTENASGGFFGIFGEAGAKVGGEIEIEWGFADGKLVGEPGFGFGVGVQDPSPGGAIMFNGGYAFTFTKGAFDM